MICRSFKILKSRRSTFSCVGNSSPHRVNAPLATQPHNNGKPISSWISIFSIIIVAEAPKLNIQTPCLKGIYGQITVTLRHIGSLQSALQYIIIFWQDFIQTLTSWYAWDWNWGPETQTSNCYFIRWNLSSVLCKNTFSTTNACCQPVKYNCRTNCQSQLIHIHQSKGSHPLKNSRIWEQCFQRIPSVSNLRLPK